MDRGTAVRAVLATKVAGTLALICLPMLTLSPEAFERVFGIQVAPELALRLLGTSYLALTVAYAHGYLDSRRGRSPVAVLAMGVVSNFGALVCAALASRSGHLALDDLRLPGMALLLFVSTMGISMTALLLIIVSHVRRAGAAARA